MTSTDAQTAALAVLGLARPGGLPTIRDRFATQPAADDRRRRAPAAWDAEVARLGPVVSVGRPHQRYVRPPRLLVRVPVRFERGQLTLLVSVIPQRRARPALQLAPAEAAEPRLAWHTAPLRRPGPL